MTQAEKIIAHALCYDVTFYPGTNEARFIVSLGELSDIPEPPDLSEKQRQWMYAILHKYRRQVPALHKTFCTDQECRKRMRDEEAVERMQLSLF